MDCFNRSNPGPDDIWGGWFATTSAIDAAISLSSIFSS
jgi:hypothetical protein